MLFLFFSFVFTFLLFCQVTVVKNEEGGNSVATVVLRGSTDSILDDLERAVDDGVNTYKVFFCFLSFALIDILFFYLFAFVLFLFFVSLNISSNMSFFFFFFIRLCAGTAA